MTVEDARAALKKAEEKEYYRNLDRAMAEKAAEKRRIDIANKKYKRAQDKLLSRMVNLTVASVEYIGGGEGTVEFTFSDGTKFSLSAQGDDATCLTYSCVGKEEL